MSHEAVALDVELIVAGRDVVEGEAAFCVGDCCTQHSLVRLSSETSSAAHNRAIRIFHGAVDLAVRVLTVREDARENSAEREL